MEKPTPVLRDFMIVRPRKRSLGVIVGRFQTPVLHAGHLNLINYSLEEFDQTLVILGVAPTISWANPLSARARAKLIQDRFSAENDQLRFASLLDVPESDAEWSVNLDIMLRQKAEFFNITLLGSRDSFLANGSYKSSMNFPRRILEEVPHTSASELRDAGIEFELLLLRAALPREGTLVFHSDYAIFDWHIERDQTLLQACVNAAGMSLKNLEVVSEGVIHYRQFCGPRIFLGCVATCLQEVNTSHLTWKTGRFRVEDMKWTGSTIQSS